jgi:flagellar basal-body rod protein FlgG
MLNTGVLAEESVSVFLQGDMQETGNPFDFAIVSDIQLPGMPFDSSGKYTDPNGNITFQPQAFFTVADANGNEHFTRNGKFTVSPQMNLITSNGELVLGSNGQPIVLQDVTGGVATPISKVSLDPQGQLVKPDGQVLTDANGAPVSLMISRVENPNRLIDEGNSLFRINPADAGQVTRIALDNQVQVRQGYTERSNVDSAQSMVDLTMAMRAYEANQKVIQFYDRSLDKAVNDVGRV